MSRYIITSPISGTSQFPFPLTQGIDITKITEVDCNGCYCYFPLTFGSEPEEGAEQTNNTLVSVHGGTILNDANEYMFRNCYALETFDCEMPNLTKGYWMFQGDKKLSDWHIDLPNLVSGNAMFMGTSISSFSNDISNLINGEMMFAWCTALTSFTSSIPKLIDGGSMFAKTKITSFTQPLDNMSSGRTMFSNSSLESFSKSLPKLEFAMGMFCDCKSLTSCTLTDTTNVTDVRDMFSGCTSLQSLNVSFPQVTQYSAFCSGCTSLTSFTGSFDVATGDLEKFFYNCSNLEELDISVPNLYQFQTNTFVGCNKLSKLRFVAPYVSSTSTEYCLRDLSALTDVTLIVRQNLKDADFGLQNEESYAKTTETLADGTVQIHYVKNT